jgi:hypothetical protein
MSQLRMDAPTLSENALWLNQGREHHYGSQNTKQSYRGAESP